MSTAIIEIENDYAESILQSLVGLNAIRIIQQSKTIPEIESTLSERFLGTLHLTDVQYEDMQKELIKSRNEWERNIY